MKTYTPTKVWKDGFGAGETRITAADLTRIEAGITAATQGVTAVESSVAATNNAVAQARTYAEKQAQAAIPIGTILPFGGLTPPSGDWLLCNGRLLNRSDYPELYKVLGASYGSMGNQNFNLPDLQGRFPVGFGAGVTFASKGGSNMTTLSVNNLPPHTHGVTAEKFAQGVGMYQSNVSNGTGWTTLSTTEQGSASALITKSTGSGQAFDTRPPYIAINFIIKAR